MKLGLVLAAGLVIGGCAGPVASVNYETDWTLTSATDATGPITLDSAHPVSLSLGSPQGGVAACNSYTVSISGGPGPITVSGGSQTEMACSPPTVMEIESRYLAALNSADHLRIDGELTITGPDVTLVFEPTAAAASVPLVGTTWHLVTLSSGDDPDDSSSSSSDDITVTLRDDGMLDITGTCNDTSADYTLDDAHLTAQHFASNGMGCSDEITARDTLLFTVLGDATVDQPTTLNRAQLILTAPGGEAASFTAD